MGTGSESGDRALVPLLGVSTFIDDEGGYTSVAVALALLVSFSLVFAAASAEWVMARSSEVQQVADAAAMAGENSVAGFSTIAQVVDACVLSMGLAGIVTYGAGLVISCVPGAGPAGEAIVKAGSDVLDSRRSFSTSAAAGLQRLEKVLPALVVANSSACVSANSDGGIEYYGCAVPYPIESASDFSSLEEDVDDEDLKKSAEDLADASERVADAKGRADDARERGWMADCGDTPYCLWQRASSLAGLAESLNPYHPTPSTWNFGVPLARSRAYYARRAEAEGPTGTGIEELTDSAARFAFYRFALDEVRSGHYAESADGSVDLELPSLPHNADETRSTILYSQAMWPSTTEDGRVVLHSSLSCPGALGPSAGFASLSQIDGGSVSRCPVCGMDVDVMGHVASASTSTENGYEHYWRIVVEASRDYEVARNEQAEAESDAREKADESEDVFSEAIDRLGVVRPTLCPPGAWGCVSVVWRGDGASVPTELTSSFLSSAELPAGCAVSAAVLAPDESTADNNVLSSFFDGLVERGSLAGGVADSVMGLWGKLLVGYGSAYGNVSTHATEFLDGLDGVFGGTVGSWLRDKLREVIRATGFEPVDMRLRKPVLTSTENVLEKAGNDSQETVRGLISSLPRSGTTTDYVTAIGAWGLSELVDGEYTVAELTIPGTDISIPLTIDLSGLGRAS